MQIVRIVSGPYKGHSGRVLDLSGKKVLIDFSQVVHANIPYRTRRTPISDSRIETWVRTERTANIPLKNVIFL